MYGHLPGRKRFLRRTGADGQLLPCMDTSRAASAFFVVQAPMVSCCHVSGLQCGHRAAGLDEIRGSAPDYQVELKALWFSRVLPTHGPTVVPSRRRSPSQLVEACHPSDTGGDGLLSEVCAQSGLSPWLDRLHCGS